MFIHPSIRLQTLSRMWRSSWAISSHTSSPRASVGVVSHFLQLQHWERKSSGKNIFIFILPIIHILKMSDVEEPQFEGRVSIIVVSTVLQFTLK